MALRVWRTVNYTSNYVVPSRCKVYWKVFISSVPNFSFIHILTYFFFAKGKNNHLKKAVLLKSMVKAQLIKIRQCEDKAISNPSSVFC